MRTFVEIFIEHINKLITNQQVYLKKNFIFKATFAVERFINHNIYYQRHVTAALKHRDKKLLKF